MNLNLERLTETYKKLFVKDNEEIKEIDKKIDLFTNVEDDPKSSGQIFNSKFFQ